MNRPGIVAHRGSSIARAEHTLAAYQRAIEDGADGVECDVRLTWDGHLVCVHDRWVNRTSTGHGKVSELSLAELTTLDFGEWHDEWPSAADELVAQRVAVPSAPSHQRGLLTLDDLLRLVVDADRPVRLFVETKHPTRYAGLVETKLVALLARFGLAAPVCHEESTVVVMSFSARAVARVRQEAPRLPTVLLLSSLAGMRNGWLPPWADIAGPGIALLRADPDYVARAGDRGHDVYCWTVDEPGDVALCARAGVRWIATNYPERTRALLAG